MEKTLPFTPAGGAALQARLVCAGDGYGEWDKTTERWIQQLKTGVEPLIEFYDLRDTAAWDTPCGQFIAGAEPARYPLSKLSWYVAQQARASRPMRNDFLLSGQRGHDHLSNGRHDDRKLDFDSAKMVVDWAFENLGDADRRAIRAAPARAEAALRMQGFECELLTASHKQTAEIWRSSRPGTSEDAHDVVITRYGISVFGDMGSLVFNVGAQYGMKFLAGDDVDYYILSKLDPMCKKVELDSRRIVQAVSQSLVSYLDDIWYGPGRAGVHDGKIHRAVLELRAAADKGESAAALDRFLKACSNHGEGGWSGIPTALQPEDVALRIENLLSDLREVRSQGELHRTLQDVSDDFAGAFDDMGGINFTTPAHSLLVKLHMANITAKKVMAVKEMLGESRQERERPRN